MPVTLEGVGLELAISTVSFWMICAAAVISSFGIAEFASIVLAIGFRCESLIDVALFF